MRLVLSGSIRYINMLRYFKYKDMLGSYHYPEQLEVITNYAKEHPVRLIVDSGAFSAWNSGEVIVLSDYIKFLKEFQSKYGSLFEELYFVNLDVIPGKRGEKVTYDQVIEAADQGLKNYEIMLNEGFNNVIHVFHQGEPITQLYKILSYGGTYIGVSPSNDATTKQRELWLDETYKHVPRSIRTHGFAVTSSYLMRHYPWFSVDSISWFMIAVYGGLLLPLDNKRQVVMDPEAPVYSAFQVYTSPRKLFSLGGYKYYEEVRPGFVKQIDAYIRFLCKLFPLTPRDLFVDNPSGRVAANLYVFRKVAESTSKHTIVEGTSLF